MTFVKEFLAITQINEETNSIYYILTSIGMAVASQLPRGTSNQVPRRHTSLPVISQYIFSCSTVIYLLLNNICIELLVILFVNISWLFISM